MSDNEHDKEYLREFLANALRAELEGRPVNQFAEWMLSDEWADPSCMGASQARGHRSGRLVDQFADVVQGEVTP